MTRHLSIPKRGTKSCQARACWLIRVMNRVCVHHNSHNVTSFTSSIPKDQRKNKLAPHHFPLVHSLFVGYTPQQLAWGTLSTIGSIFRSHVTLSETGSSLLKIVFFAPQREENIFQPLIFRVKLYGSFREGSFLGVESIPWPTWRRFPLHDRWVKAKRSRANCERRIWFGRNTNSTMEIRRIAGFYGSSSEILWAFGMGKFPGKALVWLMLKVWKGIVTMWEVHWILILV